MSHPTSFVPKIAKETKSRKRPEGFNRSFCLLERERESHFPPQGAVLEAGHTVFGIPGEGVGSDREASIRIEFAFAYADRGCNAS